jgi:hypothetical protein
MHTSGADAASGGTGEALTVSRQSGSVPQACTHSRGRCGPKDRDTGYTLQCHRYGLAKPLGSSARTLLDHLIYALMQLLARHRHGNLCRGTNHALPLRGALATILGIAHDSNRIMEDETLENAARSCCCTALGGGKHWPRTGALPREPLPSAWHTLPRRATRRLQNARCPTERTDNELAGSAPVSNPASRTQLYIRRLLRIICPACRVCRFSCGRCIARDSS